MSNKSEPVDRKTIQSMVRAAIKELEAIPTEEVK
jgi:hypothetical protein